MEKAFTWNHLPAKVVRYHRFMPSLLDAIEPELQAVNE